MYHYEVHKGRDVVANWSKFEPHIDTLASVLKLRRVEDVIKRFDSTTFSDMDLKVLYYDDKVVGFTDSNIDPKKYNEWAEVLSANDYKPDFTYRSWSRTIYNPTDIPLIPKEMFKTGRLQTVDFLDRKFIEQTILLRLACTNMAYTRFLDSTVTKVIGTPTKPDVFLQTHTPDANVNKLKSRIINLKQQKARCSDLLPLYESVQKLPIVSQETMNTVAKIKTAIDDILETYELHKTLNTDKPVEPITLLRIQPTSWKKTATHLTYTNWDLWNDVTFITSRVEESTNDYSLTRPIHIKAASLLEDREQMVIARRKVIRQ